VAPEVIQGDYGSKCDLWSVGVIMYAMLSGKMPFMASTVPETFARIIRGEFKVDTEEWSNVSPEAIDLLKKLLVVNPENRLSADEALAHPWFIHSFPDIPMPISNDVISSLRNYRVRSKLQSEAHAIIVKCLNISQIRHMKDTFMALDREKNGFLAFQELEQGLLTAGYQMAAHEIEEILQNADFKRDGRINYSEFLAATLESRALLDENVIWTAFNKFDVDNTGFITEANVKEALKRAGRAVTERQVKDMMREVEASQEGINYEEFKKLVLSNPH
jgi:calcium-dependent protein kinase